MGKQYPSNSVTKLAAVHTIACEMAKMASAGGEVIPEEDLLAISTIAQDKVPNDVLTSLDSAKTAGIIIAAITDTAREIGELDFNDNNTKTGGFNMDYIDFINYEALKEADKTASMTGIDSTIAAAQARLALVNRDPGGVQAALVEKTAAHTQILVKLANVIDGLTEEVATLVAKDRGDADAVLQGGAGVAPADAGDLDELINVDGEELGIGYMEDDQTGEESKPQNRPGGIEPNKKTTVGDAIARSTATSKKVADILKAVKKNNKK